MDLGFSEATAVVTGGTKGMGRATDDKLGGVVTIYVDRFDVFPRKDVTKPAPLDPTQMFDDTEGGYTTRGHDRCRLIKGEALHFVLDDGSVPVQEPSEGLTLVASHAQAVLHTRSLRCDIDYDSPTGPRCSVVCGAVDFDRLPSSEREGTACADGSVCTCGYFWNSIESRN